MEKSVFANIKFNGGCHYIKTDSKRGFFIIGSSENLEELADYIQSEGFQSWFKIICTEKYIEIVQFASQIIHPVLTQLLLMHQSLIHQL
jgi:hypothetical protein